MITGCKSRNPGARTITALMRTRFLQYINQPNRKDLGALQKTELFKTFCGPDGRWRKLNKGQQQVPSETTFFDWIDANFNVVRPLLAPFLTPEHKENRKAFAIRMRKEMRRVRGLLSRIIFADGTIFSKKCANSYQPEKMRVVVSRDRDAPLRSYSHKPRSISYELYEGICRGDKTGPMLLLKADPTRRVRPTVNIIEFFIGNYVAPLADRMRGRLGLAPEDKIYLCWDHAAVHRSRELLAYLEELNIEVLGLPSRCPELNVIEALWFVYKTAMRALTFEDNEEDFLRCVLEACTSVKQQTIDNLIDTFDARCASMIEHKGGPFRFRNDEHDYIYEDENDVDSEDEE